MAQLTEFDLYQRETMHNREKFGPPHDLREGRPHERTKTCVRRFVDTLGITEEVAERMGFLKRTDTRIDGQ